MSPLIALNISCAESRGNYGRFVAEPLEKGFGVTIGNALRRVLLGYLPGAAVTRIMIEGIQHEFSPIPHVKEDTMEFILNVKALRLASLSGNPGKLILEKQGEGQVCAADINPSSDFQIVNPELHLATLESPDARLYVEFDVELGIGYREAEPGDSLPAGVIGIDAIFTPMRRVNFSVDPARGGLETSHERLILEIWTDGTISPEGALSQSADILVTKLMPFAEFVSSSQEKENEQPQEGSIPDDKYNMPVEQLELSVRTMNCLRHAGITTVGEIINKGERELLLLRNFGQKSKQEIDERLEAIGLSLSAKPPDSSAPMEEE
ncbi:MAG: DNA-directed RNA polymerase subunit alpha [Chloroflexota bacterium]